MKKIHKAIGLLLLIVRIFQGMTAQGTPVKQLSATYQKGQVFLTWKNVSNTNQQYNIYRSLTPFLTSLDFNSSKYLGYVRDNSAKNIRKSQIKNSDYYFVITENQPPLASDRGLYVVTCNSGALYYYAVTVTNLSNNQEDKTVVIGDNTILLPVNEQVATPKPVLQIVTDQNNGDTSYEYVIWGNNQDESNWPAFNNVGSYGYNFTLQKRGNCQDQPLCIYFQDQDPFKKIRQ